ncbi:SDR family oxidoreductase [Roseibacillus ishigakijimensis]|uniref:SDR family oxidoreductase n=1 Tax=Roseibacillus ishigakijimensis TaxID=454146 RepID=A0A934RP54_9BACT|nr:SDR family oxidoreductase [Roseibacillus ishigakijimensis]MBK1834400.1 SDR family oxidoreductase [Roseibacillus ishigakijimensis]
MKIDLSNKIAFVTGSSSGIGQAIALELGRAGARVAVHYRGNHAGAKKTFAELQALGAPDPLIVQGDVSSPEDLAKCFTAIDQELGPLDIFINNAGLDGKKENMAEGNLATFEKVIAVNLKGGYCGMQEALQRMVPRKKGVILSITSVHEKIPWAGQAAYCASKAGVALLTQSLALELGDCGVRVLNLAPGAIKTAINKDVWQDPEQRADLLQKIPQGRLGTVKEIAEIATFLVSEQAGYIHGTTIFADGAMTAFPSFSKGG